MHSSGFYQSHGVVDKVISRLVVVARLIQSVIVIIGVGIGGACYAGADCTLDQKMRPSVLLSANMSSNVPSFVHKFTHRKQTKGGKCGAPGRNRTYGTRMRNPELFK